MFGLERENLWRVASHVFKCSCDHLCWERSKLTSVPCHKHTTITFCCRKRNDPLPLLSGVVVLDSLLGQLCQPEDMVVVNGLYQTLKTGGGFHRRSSDPCIAGLWVKPPSFEPYTVRSSYRDMNAAVAVVASVCAPAFKRSMCLQGLIRASNR